MKHPRAERIKPSRWRDLKFKVRNFISGRYTMCIFNICLWFRIQARRRRDAKMDPRWRESWWVLERRYTKLAKKYCKLELRYMRARDKSMRARSNGKARGR